MAGVNKVTLLGNIGRDPEITYTNAGIAVCKIALATSRKKKDGQEVTSWHRCTAFQKNAELIAQYVQKGNQLYLEGELSYGSYEKNGVTRYTTDIIIQNINFIGSRPNPGNGNNQGTSQNPGPQNQNGFQNQIPNNNNIPDDDIPF